MLVLAPVLRPQAPVKLQAPDAEPFDQYGWAVDVHGSTAVVGSRLSDLFGMFNTGAVYVHERGGVVHKILPTVPAQNARFGTEVALHGDLLAVGAVNSTGAFEAGAVEVYIRHASAWRPMQRILPPDPQHVAHFGEHLALEDDLLVVGSAREDAPLFNSGAVHVYRRIGDRWEHEALLIPDDSHAEQYFGSSVDVSAGRIVVGAPWDSASALLGGAAYVFERRADTWTQTVKLAALDLQAHDDFGVSVAISGDRVAVGMASDDDVGNGSGAVYVYRTVDGEWVFDEKVQPSDPQADHNFGRRVQIDGETLLVGAVDPQGKSPSGGAAYVFRAHPEGWRETRKISTPAPGITEFASSLALHGEAVVCGGYLDDGQGSEAGAAWFVPIETP